MRFSPRWILVQYARAVATWFLRRVRLTSSPSRYRSRVLHRCSEIELQRELQLPRVLRADELSEVDRAQDCGREDKVGAVEQIESLRPELQPRRLGEFEIALQRH